MCSQEKSFCRREILQWAGEGARSYETQVGENLADLGKARRCDGSYSIVPLGRFGERRSKRVVTDHHGLLRFPTDPIQPGDLTLMSSLAALPSLHDLTMDVAS